MEELWALIAFLGIEMDYTEFSGNRIGLILNGTVVKLIPVNPTAAGLNP